MNLCQFGLYFSLLCVVFNCCLAASDYVNTKCKTSGVAGKCKLITDCPLALDQLKRNYNHNLKRCGFDGFVEIVCCPEVTTRHPASENSDEDSVANRFTRRRCEQACEELSKNAKSTISFHIIGGEDANIEDFPHMAALAYETEEGSQWDCSATVISKHYLLTAAHCIANIRQLVPKRARLGVTKLNDTHPQDYVINNVTIHPQYNPSNKHNDIALIKVDKEIKFSKKVYPACLYAENKDPQGLIVTGWGKTSIGSEDDRSNILQKAVLVAVPIAQCNISYFTRSLSTVDIINSQLCAGSNVSDACWGDSGGPLQIQNDVGSYSVVGIISYGAGCGGKTPGVYTRVSRFLDWIESIVWP